MVLLVEHTFKLRRIAEGEWQIEAHYAGAEIRYVKGFKSMTNGLRAACEIDRLRSQGYAK